MQLFEPLSEKVRCLGKGVNSMKKRNRFVGYLVLLMLISTFLILSACIVVPGHRGQVGVVIAPPLPPVVELEFPYEFYFYNGYYYRHRNNDWYYSHSKSGPWNNLPRERHPREVRHKGRGGDQDRDKRHDNDDKRGNKDRGGHDRN